MYRGRGAALLSARECRLRASSRLGCRLVDAECGAVAGWAVSDDGG
jgi:hypothetical protein